MLFSLFHFLSGYCRIVLSGMNQERFLNLCAAKQILLWNIKREGKHYIFYISRGGYKELQEISEKREVHFGVYRKKESRICSADIKKESALRWHFCFVQLFLLLCPVLYGRCR